MASYPSMKMKRKDLTEANEDFFEFSLSSPARKIRRLGAELPPIIEEEPEMPLHSKHSSSEIGASNGLQEQLRESVIEELPSLPENEERAIVLFKPPNTPLLNSPHNFFVDSDLILSVKHQAIWGTNPTHNQSVEDEDYSKADENLAVIPWVPSQQVHQKITPEASQSEVFSEPMDSKEMEMEQATMDYEDNNALSIDQLQQANEYNMISNEGMQQHWQQQHCLIPQFPQNLTTPVVWYR